LSLKLGDTRVYEPQIRARLGTTAHCFKVLARDHTVSREASMKIATDTPVEMSVNNMPLCRFPCPPRQKSRVERLKAKVEPLLTYVTVENFFVGSTTKNGQLSSGFLISST